LVKRRRKKQGIEEDYKDMRLLLVCMFFYMLLSSVFQKLKDGKKKNNWILISVARVVQ
jgi:hypothetical protein